MTGHTISVNDPALGMFAGTAAAREIERLREALREVIIAWDQLYSKTTHDQFPFAEDLEFGPLNRARLVYDIDWHKHNAFGNSSDETVSEGKV